MGSRGALYKRTRRGLVSQATYDSHSRDEGRAHGISLERFDRRARGATTSGRRLRREEERGNEAGEDDGRPHEERVVEADDVRGARHVPRHERSGHDKRIALRAPQLERPAATVVVASVKAGFEPSTPAPRGPKRSAMRVERGIVAPMTSAPGSSRSPVSTSLRPIWF